MNFRGVSWWIFVNFEQSQASCFPLLPVLMLSQACFFTVQKWVVWILFQSYSPKCPNYFFKKVRDWNLNTTQKLNSFCLLDIWTSANLISQNSWSLVCVYFRRHFSCCCCCPPPSKVETDQLLILVFPSTPPSWLAFPHFSSLCVFCVSLLIYDRQMFL